MNQKNKKKEKGKEKEKRKDKKRKKRKKKEKHPPSSLARTVPSLARTVPSLARTVPSLARTVPSLARTVFRIRKRFLPVCCPSIPALRGPRREPTCPPEADQRMWSSYGVPFESLSLLYLPLRKLFWV